MTDRTEAWKRAKAFLCEVMHTDDPPANWIERLEAHWLDLVRAKQVADMRHRTLKLSREKRATTVNNAGPSD